MQNISPISPELDTAFLPAIFPLLLPPLSSLLHSDRPYLLTLSFLSLSLPSLPPTPLIHLITSLSPVRPSFFSHFISSFLRPALLPPLPPSPLPPPLPLFFPLSPFLPSPSSPSLSSLFSYPLKSGSRSLILHLSLPPLPVYLSLKHSATSLQITYGYLHDI